MVGSLLQASWNLFENGTRPPKNANWWRDPLPPAEACASGPTAMSSLLWRYATAALGCGFKVRAKPGQIKTSTTAGFLCLRLGFAVLGLMPFQGEVG